MRGVTVHVVDVCVWLFAVLLWLGPGVLLCSLFFMRVIGLVVMVSTTVAVVGAGGVIVLCSVLL